MITTEEMKNACGHSVILTYKGREPMQTYVEDYIEADPAEDEEPMLFLTRNLAAFQSGIVSIKIID